MKQYDKIVIRLPSIAGVITYFLSNSKQKIIIDIAGCGFDSYWALKGIKTKFLAIFMYLMMRYIAYKVNNISYVTQKYLQNKYPSGAKNKLACTDAFVHFDEEKFKLRIKSINKRNNKPIKIGMVGNYETTYKGFDTALMSIKTLNQNNGNGRYFAINCWWW